MSFRLPRLILLTLLFATLTTQLSAQDLYTVRAGVFREVRGTDFDNIRDLGFVYGLPASAEETEVFVGQYAQLASANQVVTTLQQRGFRNAQAFTLPAAGGQEVFSLQIALQGNNRPIDWDKYLATGDLLVESVDGTVKVLSGTYPTYAAAAAALPRIKALGLQDAFVKKINTARLVPIGSFETGIKKPLIPITQQQPPVNPPVNNPVVTTPPPTTQTPATSQPTPSAPASYGSTPGGVAVNPRSTTTPTTSIPAAANPPTLPAGTTSADLPSINPRTKRSSTAELQRVLKEKGYYDGSVDGLYGPGTTTAYQRAWNDMPEIRKYRLLSGAALSSVNPNADRASQWPEVAVLLAIVNDLAAGTENVQRGRTLAQQREQLFDARQPLAATAASRARNWSTTVWANLNEWAAEDPLHASMISALRVAYQQSHVRLEERYQQAGLDAIAARDLATAMLQNLTGAQLDRFL